MIHGFKNYLKFHLYFVKEIKLFLSNCKQSKKQKLWKILKEKIKQIK